MKKLIHNGIMVPKKYQARGLHLTVKGEKLSLTPEQEEMAVAWVKKLGTDYVNDRIFVSNFFGDFAKVLSISGRLFPEDIDFSEVVRVVEEERNYRNSLSKEEKKRLAQMRKIEREANKEKYGYATVDGIKVEIGNYAAEPSSIFMGRGDHPLRGKWKAGPDVNDIILNLSPDAPRPAGNWKEIVWESEYMWVARWKDRLTDKMKYIWLSDSFIGKQKREIEKFDKANELEKAINKLRRHISFNLTSEDMTRRKLATVSYLIDKLKLRVGDEKDKDEADTVGATTLRPEHIHIKSDGTTVFDFLGKDYVRWRKEIKLPPQVIENLEELRSTAKSSMFNGIRSDNVKLFLSEAVTGLTAKVFRTYHASRVVRDYLKNTTTLETDPDYVKRHTALMANLQAAIECNHKRKLPKKWHESLEKKKERLKKLRQKKTPKAKERVKELKLKIEAAKKTKDYNLNTSLKSYVDPRIYFEWAEKVNYDWKLYYSKTLQKKFSWVETH